MSEYRFKWTLGTTLLLGVFLSIVFVWVGIPLLLMLSEWIFGPYDPR